MQAAFCSIMQLCKVHATPMVTERFCLGPAPVYGETKPEDNFVLRFEGDSGATLAMYVEVRNQGKFTEIVLYVPDMHSFSGDQELRSFVDRFLQRAQLDRLLEAIRALSGKRWNTADYLTIKACNRNETSYNQTRTKDSGPGSST